MVRKFLFGDLDFLAMMNLSRRDTKQKRKSKITQEKQRKKNTEKEKEKKS